jgi:hypothetical protein
MVRNAHKYHGYAVTAITQIAVSVGIAHYLNKHGKPALAVGGMLANLGFFGGVIATLEYKYRQALEQPLIKKLQPSTTTISVSEF